MVTKVRLKLIYHMASPGCPITTNTTTTFCTTYRTNLNSTTNSATSPLPLAMSSSPSPPIDYFTSQLINCVVRFALSPSEETPLENAIEITPFLLATQLESVREILREAEKQDSKKKSGNIHAGAKKKTTVKEQRMRVYTEDEGFYIGGYEKTFWVEKNGAKYTVGSKEWEEY